MRGWVALRNGGKALLARIGLYPAFLSARKIYHGVGALAGWVVRGFAGPPPHFIKQRVLRCYARRYRLTTLVETGTYYGDMVQAMKPHFSKVYSIELSDMLYTRARARFVDDTNVELVHGDSGKELKKIVKELQTPALFWLDGHYSMGITAKGEETTPIVEEIEAIAGSGVSGHVIIIDDARLFGGDPEYPSMNAIRRLVEGLGKGWEMSVKYDSIRIIPTTSS